jgi:hypothetical protein
LVLLEPYAEITSEREEMPGVAHYSEDPKHTALIRLVREEAPGVPLRIIPLDGLTEVSPDLYVVYSALYATPDYNSSLWYRPLFGSGGWLTKHEEPTGRQTERFHYVGPGIPEF